MILCDTNVLIEAFKGNEKIIRKLEHLGLDNIGISSVTVMELYYGALNKRELNKIKKEINALTIVHMGNAISESAVNLIECYGKSHSLQIPDAIIAATALWMESKLLTLNIKDFQFINGISFS